MKKTHKPTSVRHVKDQLLRDIIIEDSIERIVSLVPSQTELLFDLGLGDRVVGITKFCVRPEEWFRSKTRVGGTKQLKLDVIRELNPDLILANKEENEEAQINALAADFPVWVSDVRNLLDAWSMMRSVGDMTNTKDGAEEIIQDTEDLLVLDDSVSTVNAAYFIWNNPMMVAGGNTFIDHMMLRLDVTNVFARTERYPEVSEEMLTHANLDLILLSSEPFPFSDKHATEFERLCPKAQVLLVDGQIFSWYGSRMRHAADYFIELRRKITKWEGFST